MPTDNKTRAAQLKDEGNKLYVKKDYALAYSKYSEAIDLDPNNAVLYANRAACLLAMDKFMDATIDGTKATDLDPMYTKAWARLGMAQKNSGNYEASMAAYRRALNTLPVENLSQTDKNVKQQCEDELEAVRREKENKASVILANAFSGRQLPWNRAANMKDELYERRPSGEHSSAWILLEAYEEFKLGMDLIKEVRRIVLSPQGNGGMIVGRLGALESLTNALLMDSRVFHIDDKGFQEKYNLQVEMEVTQTGAFTTGGTQHVMAESLKLKETGGWDAVRPAITTTVRCWIMRAFITDGFGSNKAAAIPFYDQAIEVLEWGRQVWRNVPRDDRGAIFEDTFLRGVKCLRLDCYMKACMRDRDNFPLETLYQDAQDMIREVNAATVGEAMKQYPGFRLAFHVYPRGQALAMIGLYHRELGHALKSQPNADAEPCVHYQAASKAYEEAADVYPSDDENHVWYLCCAFDMMRLSGAYVKDFFIVADKIRAALTGMKKIWEFSSLAAAREAALSGVLRAEKVLREAVENGELTAEQVLVPHGVI